MASMLLAKSSLTFYHVRGQSYEKAVFRRFVDVRLCDVAIKTDMPMARALGPNEGVAIWSKH